MARPSRSQPRSSAVEMPEVMLEPERLLRTFFPSASRISVSRLLTVVLPLVPVTAMMVPGFPTYRRKSGHSFSASEPGKSVPLCRVIFSAGTDSFQPQCQ